MSTSKGDIAASEAAPVDGHDPHHQAPLQFPTKDALAHTKSMDEVIASAKTATDKEHTMTLWQGIRLYPKAVGWSVLISTCICMEGYDVCLLSNFCEPPHPQELSSPGFSDLRRRRVPPVQPKIWAAITRRDISSACTLAGGSE
jgi:hypothetical protein